MRFRTLAFAPLIVVAIVAGCSSSGSLFVGRIPEAPASVGTPSAGSCFGGTCLGRLRLRLCGLLAASSAAAGAATVEAKAVGSIGTVLVASQNGMTVYTFTKDVKDSGKSACTGGCIDKWPALTVAPAGRRAAGPA